MAINAFMDFSPTLDFWVPALRIYTDGAINILLRLGKFITVVSLLLILSLTSKHEDTNYKRPQP